MKISWLLLAPQRFRESVPNLFRYQPNLKSSLIIEIFFSYLNCIFRHLSRQSLTFVIQLHFNYFYCNCNLKFLENRSGPTKLKKFRSSLRSSGENSAPYRHYFNFYTRGSLAKFSYITPPRSGPPTKLNKFRSSLRNFAPHFPLRKNTVLNTTLLEWPLFPKKIP